jgi:hypothetical protein
MTAGCMSVTKSVYGSHAVRASGLRTVCGMVPVGAHHPCKRRLFFAVKSVRRLEVAAGQRNARAARQPDSSLERSNAIATRRSNRTKTPGWTRNAATIGAIGVAVGEWGGGLRMVGGQSSKLSLLLSSSHQQTDRVATQAAVKREGAASR